ncbi:glycosyltransferase [Sphingomonas sp. QA11]|uniref:glycosyltransferase n=1 Tax=Sphingomonas sp. QA11 TaxID=2950605 RepID=UPI00234BD46B|nr:glycosyltransferase [Sphingomonas sp. QA11]WCM29687.1 glycosyltransferase [Sphingomonas sp. QA11]
MTGVVPLNLGILTTSLSSEAGGLFESVRFPANLMRERGHSVSVYGVTDPALTTTRDAWEVSHFRAFPSIGPKRFGFAPGLSRELDTKAFDALHLHGLWNHTSIAARSWNRKNDGALVISPHGMLDPWAQRNSQIKKRVAKWAFENANLRSAGVLRALCWAEADAIEALGLGVPIAVIPNGISLPGADYVPTKPADTTRKRLLFLGRIHPKKGIAELIDAWAIAAAKSPTIRNDWVLQIAGWDDGDHLQHLVRLARERELDNVEFSGPLFGSAKQDAYANCDAFILPSYSEGMPMTVLEAWAHRKPVLMTHACNIPEGFVAGGAYRIETSPQPLAVALAYHLDQPSALAETGERGRRLVEERFTWERIVDQHIGLFTWLSGRGPRPHHVAD